jgi:divalent metal cation (Fe/Co/Zn/Cd) transporter
LALETCQLLRPEDKCQRKEILEILVKNNVGFDLNNTRETKNARHFIIHGDMDGSRSWSTAEQISQRVVEAIGVGGAIDGH